MVTNDILGILFGEIAAIQNRQTDGLEVAGCDDGVLNDGSIFQTEDRVAFGGETAAPAVEKGYSRCAATARTPARRPTPAGCAAPVAVPARRRDSDSPVRMRPAW